MSSNLHTSQIPSDAMKIQYRVSAGRTSGAHTLGVCVIPYAMYGKSPSDLDTAIDVSDPGAELHQYVPMS